MTDARAARPRRGARLVRVLATWLVLQLAVAVGAVVLLAPAADAPLRPGLEVADGAVRGAPVAPAADPRAVREQGVQALLDARAAALLARDRDRFLAGVWAGDAELQARQATLFDNLAGVPLGTWEYRLDGTAERPSAELDARYGKGQWWAPQVVLVWAIAEFDPEPTYAPQRFVFLREGERWVLAADDEAALGGTATARGLWDGGPVVSVRGRSTLVLGHPGSEPLLRQVADGVDDAVPRVTGVWGPDWTQKVVVLVPDDATELDRLLGGSTDLTRIAAVATAELTDLDGGYRPVGNRVIVNPPNFAKLGPLGRQVVLTHETAHVATRSASGPDMPTWLVEGLADYIGYLDVPVPVETAARETRAARAEGRLPTSLPADADFDGGNPRLPLAYEASWLAFRLLVETYGQEPALAFYRAVGASRDAGPDAALDAAFAAELGTTTAAFTARWADHLASLSS